MTRPFTVHDVEQRSPAWFALRVGMLTGSHAGAIIAERKKGNGELAVRRDLRRQLVCERVTGLGVDDLPFLPRDMQRGMDLEPAAFAAYELTTGLPAMTVGFVSHPTLKAGCSPDGYIGSWINGLDHDEWIGGLELKCPKSTTHLDYLTAPETLRQEYLGQAIHGLWLTGAQWWDICSFDDRFPSELELVRVRVARDQVDLVAYELAVTIFLREVDEQVEKIQALRMAAA